MHNRRIYSPLPGLNNSFAQVSLLKFAPSLFFILLLAPDSLLHAHSQRWLTSFHFLRDHSLALSLLVAFDGSWNALRVPTTNTSTCHGMQTAVLFTSLLLIAGDAPCWFLYLGRLAKKKRYLAFGRYLDPGSLARLFFMPPFVFPSPCLSPAISLLVCGFAHFIHLIGSPGRLERIYSIGRTGTRWTKTKRSFSLTLETEL